MVSFRVTFERTWLERYLRLPTLALELDRRDQAKSASEPIPLDYQSAIPPEKTAQLPDVVGRYPLGPFLPRYERALARGVRVDELPGLDWAPPPPDPGQVLAIANRGKHTNFRVDLADGVDTVLVPEDLWRNYLLVVNEGASDCFIAFDKSADDGLPLAANGGFHELNNGTISSVSARGDGGATVLKIVEGRAPTTLVCQLPCE